MPPLDHRRAASRNIDADRVHPGDGVAPLVPMLRDLHALAFRGMLSLESFELLLEASPIGRSPGRASRRSGTSTAKSLPESLTSSETPCRPPTSAPTSSPW